MPFNDPALIATGGCLQAQDFMASNLFARNISEFRKGPIVRAVTYIREVGGGSQAKLMRCSDGNFYIVKFQNNPQGRRVLVNEMLGHYLASKLGLPIPSAKVVYVDSTMITSESLALEFPNRKTPVTSGFCFGSQHPGPTALSYRFWPKRMLERISNLKDFVGMLVFDVWTSNADTRQVVFYPKEETSPGRVLLIDNGFCFSGARWLLSDRVAHALSSLPAVYDCVVNIDSFEPWLTRLERKICPATIFDAFRRMPQEWYEKDEQALINLLVQLNERRKRVRSILESLCAELPRHFANWQKGKRGHGGSTAACQLGLVTNP